MTTTSHINAETVARDLLADAEVGYPVYGPSPRTRVDLPDGRHATLRVTFEESSGIGRWLPGRHQSGEHHDDIFGVFAWRHTDPDTGRPGQRPDGFDGRAQVLTGDARGDRWEGDVWWRPTDDDTDPARTLEYVRAWMRGDWYHVGLTVEIVDPGADTESAALWGVEWGLDDPEGDHARYLQSTVAELLDEAGIGNASTSSAPRWSRDLLEAVARRVSGEDPDDPPADAYHDTLRALVAWFDNYPDEWDRFAAPMADQIEAEFRSHTYAEGIQS